MSAGSFINSKYQSDTGDIHQIKIQPETAAVAFDGVANAAPTGAVDSVFAAEVNRGARAYGLRPRKITIAFETDVPAGYRPYTSITVPVLQESVFSGAVIGDPVSFQGSAGTVRSKSAENILPGEAALGGAADPTP